MKGVGAFLAGAFVGAIAIILAQRVQETLRDEDAESLSERISKRLTELEDRSQATA